MTNLESLEKTCNDVFVTKSPPLPAGGKKFIVTYLPFASVIIGILTVSTAWTLWRWAHVSNDLINYANNMNSMYGDTPVIPTSRMNISVWFAIVILLFEAFLYLSAYQPTKDRKKAGWNLLFYAALVNFVYGIIGVFTNYDGFSSLIGIIIGTSIGLYLLFQVREEYLPRPQADATTKHTAAKK